MGVKEGADEEEGDADPRQHVTVAEVPPLRVLGSAQDVLPVEGEDEASGKGRESCGGEEGWGGWNGSLSTRHYAMERFLMVLSWSHTCECLAEACDVEELAFGYSQELNKENQEGDGGEDQGQDHERLDGLQPV